ncbi:unnamed protein product [Schistocephalus solidus]|uniref:Polypyrimidine tract-binding protein 1 n=1 Tax=Schistocephalus solidus TaxID=70667 RepID=A0A183S862_SCHSO|nr:unnamed protein product [Schistocephalus solidus]
MDHIDAPPSKVVHVRGLPSDATEQDIALLAIPFGQVVNMVLSKRNNQALIEMELLERAIEMVNYFQEYPALLHGKQLILQFSKHEHLELKAENPAVEHAINNANAIAQQDLSGAASGMPNTVLRILIDNIMDQQINHIIIYKHLNGQNIYTGCCSLTVEFSKNRGPLEIRHESPRCRDYVSNPLTEEEQNSLRRLPSAGLSNISSQSFSGPMSAQGMSSQMTGMVSQFGGMLSSGMQGLPPTLLPPSNNACRLNELTAQLIALAQQAGFALTPAAAAATASFMTLTSQTGSSGPAGAFPGNSAISPAMASLLALSAATGNAHTNRQFPVGGHGAPSQSSVAHHGGTLPVNPLQLGAQNTQNSPIGFRLPPNNNGSTVLIVSNLNEEVNFYRFLRMSAASRFLLSLIVLSISLQLLPTLTFPFFSFFHFHQHSLLSSSLAISATVLYPFLFRLRVYGDVLRVKIMFNKKDTALIQFTDSQQALLALQYLDHQQLWGRPMKVAVSRHNFVQLPKEEKDTRLTKDYTNNLLHRFRKPNSKNYQNIYPPSHVLHLSNIPPTVTEEDVRALFASKGFAVVGFRFMQKDNKMALVQLDSVESAMEALIQRRLRSGAQDLAVENVELLRSKYNETENRLGHAQVL